MPGSPIERTPLDGTVGGVGWGDEAPRSPTADLPVLVFVGGAAEEDPRAVGLVEDVRLLIHAFLLDPDSVRTSQACADIQDAPDASGDIEIAIHGLTLEPDAEAELHERIQGLVRQRFLPDEETR
ncbi:MAG TPA: hypothetical protein VFA00_10600 [Actinomycetota bacterium]|nr:hypothetical protein [Actinomycetota bacterium]